MREIAIDHAQCAHENVPDLVPISLAPPPFHSVIPPPSSPTETQDRKMNDRPQYTIMKEEDPSGR